MEAFLNTKNLTEIISTGEQEQNHMKFGALCEQGVITKQTNDLIVMVGEVFMFVKNGMNFQSLENGRLQMVIKKV